MTIETEVCDVEALRLACRRRDLPEPVHRTAKLFTAEATGFCVELPDWKFPVVCECDTGTVHYDNFEGRWGDPALLDSLLQTYAVEKTKLEARRAGYSVIERAQENGSIRLSIEVGGAA